MSEKTYYLSKYALSEGIQPVEVTDQWRSDSGVERVYVRGRYNSFVLGKEVHESEESAKVAAHAARKKRIASLKRQIAKLEAKTF